MKRTLSPASPSLLLAVGVLAASFAVTATSSAQEPAGSPAGSPAALPTVVERFASAEATEEPSFQRHVIPLFGRLGCNGRSCHGSFQGAGGFQLSLFGYDFKADYEALTKPDSQRVHREAPAESLIIVKPTSDDEHEGGQRYEPGGWEHHLIGRWIESGAKFDAQQIEKLAALEVSPQEILFSNSGDKSQLRAIAVWGDGTREDVTPLCRFTTNNDQIALVDENGMISSADAGDTDIVIAYDKAVVTVPVLRPLSDRVAENYPAVEMPTKIDELVVDKLRKLGIVPSDRCDDAEFLRRVSLDLAGTLPSVKEIEAFLANDSPNKRSEKIEELLETPAYAAWWTTKLCDFTGNNDQQLNNVTPVRRGGQEWYDWIYKRVSENMAYDELAAGIVLAKSRESGQSYTEYCEEMSQIYAPGSDKSYADLPTLTHYWSRNNFRQPDDRAVGFAYAFMGVRIQCAQCHKHPFDTWSKQDFEEFRTFFTRVNFVRGGQGPNTRQEAQKIIANLGIDTSKPRNQQDRDMQRMVLEGKTITFGELAVLPPRGGPAIRPGQPRPGQPRRGGGQATEATLLGTDTKVNIARVDDPRKPLMEWLRSPDNPYFARAFVNRVWANYFNVGIVEPPDDMSLGNPPSNKPLLDYLAQGFIEHNYDMKWLHREITNSATYQRSWRPNDTNAKDERNFSRSVPRRLPAEVAYDAIQRATAAEDKADHMLTDLSGRGISVPGSGPNANGGRGAAGFALRVFGRSTRESNCDCDRSMEASLLQTVYLQNDNDIHNALNPSGRGTWMAEVNALVNPPARRGPAAGPRGQAGGRRPGGQNANNVEAIRQDMARTRFRLEAAKRLENEQRVALLEARIEQLQKDLREARERDSRREPEPAPEREEVAEPTPLPPGVEAPALVREAYLRTLSRPPTVPEMERSLLYLAEAKSPALGMRDLMWALLNTKEFIVNH
jgi:hypothetical protein